MKGRIRTYLIKAAIAAALIALYLHFAIQHWATYAV